MSVPEAAVPVSGTDKDQLCINTIRTLSIDGVQQAQVRASRYADGAPPRLLSDFAKVGTQM